MSGKIKFSLTSISNFTLNCLHKPTVNTLYNLLTMICKAGFEIPSNWAKTVTVTKLDKKFVRSLLCSVIADKDLI